MNLLDLAVKVMIDDQASDKVETLGKNLGSGLTKAAKIGTAAVSAAMTGIAALTKQPISEYSEFEQLVGGVETLFKGSADAIGSYASEAYKTAGMSANEYMTTVTAFSASLLQSMGNDTDAAAEKANLAITDMSDNANKMGSTMESIQNAYSGFAKQNYTMLDNLKLGYGGTKEEMQRLLDDANALNAAQGNYTNYTIESYADIVDAIHTVQTEMGITGTTAKEASTTIQGSISSMKASWENLKVALADSDGLNLNGRINEFVESVVTVGNNVIPRVEQILQGVGKAISGFSPILSEQIPQMLAAVLPSLLDSAISLTEGALSGVVAVLPSLLDTAVNALPSLISAAVSIIGNFAGALIDAAPMILGTGMELLGQLTTGIESGIPDMLGRLPQVIEAWIGYFTTMAPTIIEKGGELLGHLIAGILGAIPEIAVQMPAVIKALGDALSSGWSKLRDTGKYLIEGLWQGISDRLAWLKSKITGVVDSIKGVFTGKNGFDTHSPSKWSRGVFRYVMDGAVDGLESGMPSLMNSVGGIADSVKNGFELGTVSVDYAHSTTGIIDRAIRSTADNGRSTQPIIIDFTAQLDGKTLVHQMVPIMRNEARAMGI